MATKRRGGFGTPELRGTLGTLLRTTTGVVRDALERGAREGRARLDDVRAGRRRQDALAELGELVLDLIRRGEIDLAELPEARDLVRQLDDLDGELEDEPAPPRALTRSRFDDRARRSAPESDDDGTVSSSVAAGVASGATARGTVPPPMPADRGPSSGAMARGTRLTPAPDEGAPVPSGTRTRAARPTSPGLPRNSDGPSTRTPTMPIRDSWRPSSNPDDVPTPADMPAARRSLPHDPYRKGGISFDDDDLHEYMHPDDVPPKDPPRNPGDGEA